MDRYDIAIVGSGFAGSMMAMIARRLGRSVVLIDKGKHPRVVIGESSTPLTNLLLEELTTRYDLPNLRPLAKWGSWQRAYPEIACGLKRGFTFYHHDRNQPSASTPDRAKQLLVTASPNDQIADTHWYRADFDHFLVRQAQDMGVDYMDETDLTGLTQAATGITLEGRRNHRSLALGAKSLIDASGPRGFLHRTLGLGEIPLPNLPGTQSLYSHFTGVERLEHTTFGANDIRPPYSIDDAAVHHVFDGGWMWELRFNNGITSAGVAATDRVASELNFADGAEAWRRLLLNIPALQAQFANAKFTKPFTHVPRLSFRSATVSGANWAMLPSAAGFVDPLLSTGFPLTLSGVARLAAIIDKDWESSSLPLRLQQYAAETEADLLAAERLIAALYANMHDFPAFSALSLLYFAAVSYAETARRLGKPHLANAFLLHDHAVFGPAARDLLEQAQLARSPGDSAKLIEDVLRTIEPFNLIGLGDPRRSNWYPVDPQDLFSSASKVEASHTELSQMLHRCGFGIPVDGVNSASEPNLTTMV